MGNKCIGQLCFPLKNLCLVSSHVSEMLAAQVTWICSLRNYLKLHWDLPSTFEIDPTCLRKLRNCCGNNKHVKFFFLYCAQNFHKGLHMRSWKTPLVCMHTTLLNSIFDMQWDLIKNPKKPNQKQIFGTTGTWFFFFFKEFLLIWKKM